MLNEHREALRSLLKRRVPGEEYNAFNEGWNSAIYTVLAKNLKPDAKLAPPALAQVTPGVVSAAAGDPEVKARETIYRPGEQGSAVDVVAQALERQR